MTLKSETFCDNCHRAYQPLFGNGTIKLQYCDPLHPIVDTQHPDDKRYNKPNLKTIRMDDMCPECTEKIFELIEKLKVEKDLTVNQT